ncbi:MAG: hypothetical protein PF480_02510 [Roseovarius sp.]|jgi:hypothetical protein|nr:hypothetical protein [Roseovarius sp.]
MKIENTQQYQEFEWCPGAESNHRHEDFQSFGCLFLCETRRDLLRWDDLQESWKNLILTTCYRSTPVQSRITSCLTLLHLISVQRTHFAVPMQSRNKIFPRTWGRQQILITTKEKGDQE